MKKVACRKIVENGGAEYRRHDIATTWRHGWNIMNETR